MKIDYLLPKKNLATLCFVLVGLVFLLMFFQTLNGKFEQDVNEAWGWLFPTVLPTLSLILTVFVFDMRNTQKQVVKVDRFYFRLVFSLSLFYMIIILLILLSQPITGQPIIILMKVSNIYLGPIQAIITGAMGLFFVKKE